MAPSRALLRLSGLSMTKHLHPYPRQLYASAITYQITPNAPFPHLSRSWLSPSTCLRSYSDSARIVPKPPSHLNEAELHIFNKVKAELEPVKLEVKDISGGCGSMYAIDIESPKFKGLTVVKQHKLVNQVLQEEIKNWHGVQLRTRIA